MPCSSFKFGPFRLIPGQRALLKGGRPVRLGSRAFDMLVALAQRGGEVVSKSELLACAWPDTCVEDVTVRGHIAILRRILGDEKAGDRYIVSVSGRGYCFVAPVIRLESSLVPRWAETVQPLVRAL